MSHVQAVWVDEKLYIEIGSSGAGSSNIMRCNSSMQFQTDIKSPAYWSALTTYQGKLVLVGGVDITVGPTTNKLWSLQDDDKWAEDLPPMLTQRNSVTALSTSNYLLVAGGRGVSGAEESAVEVFDGLKWSTTAPLPKGGPYIRSALLNGELYLMGGWWQGCSVFSAELATLLASAGTGEGTHSVWRTLPEAPLKVSSPVAFGSLLLAIGGAKSIRGEYFVVNDKLQ